MDQQNREIFSQCDLEYKANFHNVLQFLGNLKKNRYYEKCFKMTLIIPIGHRLKVPNQDFMT